MSSVAGRPENGAFAHFMFVCADVKLQAAMRRRCPVCKKTIDPTGERSSREGNFYPFCSQRCKLIDLGRWLDAEYRIVSKPGDEEGADTGEEPADGDKKL